MKRHGHLWDQVVGFQALCAAAGRAARGKPLGRDTAAFLFHLETEVLTLQEELLSGTYRPSAYHTFPISDPKDRIISVLALM